MTVRFLDIAEIELDQAIHWYGAQAPRLDNAFLIEVLSAANRIARFPEAWHSPLDDGDILVLADAHLHRRPDYWRDRLKQ